MMVLARSFLVALAVLVVESALTAPAWVEYSPASFAAAQREGKTIVVDIYATWCPVCRVQGPILDELRGESALSHVTFVKVDFDTQKAFLQAHRVPRQSTVLVFEGEREVGRSIAESDRDRLREFVLGTAGRGS